MKLITTLATAASLFAFSAQADLPEGDWLIAKCEGPGEDWDTKKLSAKQVVKAYIRVNSQEDIKLVATVETDAHYLKDGEENTQELLHGSLIELTGDLQLPSAEEKVESGIQSVFKINDGEAVISGGSFEGSKHPFTEFSLIAGEAELPVIEGEEDELPVIEGEEDEKKVEPRNTVRWVYQIDGEDAKFMSAPDCEFLNDALIASFKQLEDDAD